MASSGEDFPSDGDSPPAAAAVAGSAHLLGFSDEILLHILSHVPSTDLVVNVRHTCRKLAELCLDKSLTHTVLLQRDYEVRRCRRGPGEAARAGDRPGDPAAQHGRLLLAVGRHHRARGPLPQPGEGGPVGLPPHLPAPLQGAVGPAAPALAGHRREPRLRRRPAERRVQGHAEPRAGAPADAVHALVRRGALLHQPREAAAVLRDPGPHARGRHPVGPAHGGPEQRAPLPEPARLLRPPGARLHQPGGGAAVPGRAQRPHPREPARLPHLRARQLRRERGHPEPAGLHGPQRGAGRPAAAQVLAQQLGPAPAHALPQPLLPELQPLHRVRQPADAAHPQRGQGPAQPGQPEPQRLRPLPGPRLAAAQGGGRHRQRHPGDAGGCLPQPAAPQPVGRPPPQRRGPGPAPVPAAGPAGPPALPVPARLLRGRLGAAGRPQARPARHARRALRLRQEGAHRRAGVSQPLPGAGGPAALLRVLVSAEEPALPAAPRADRVQLLLRHAPQRARHPQLAAALQPGAERGGRGGGRHRPAGLPEAPDAGPAAQRSHGLRAGQHRPAVPAAPVPLAGQPGHDGEGGVHVRPVRHAEALHAAEGPQAGAALLQRQRAVLPGAEPVLRAAAPVPGVPQRHPAARGGAGLHGPLPARRRVPHVHRRVPGRLQEPAADPPPQFPGRAARAERGHLPAAARGPGGRDPGRAHGAPGRDHPVQEPRGRGAAQPVVVTASASCVRSEDGTARRACGLRLPGRLGAAACPAPGRGQRRPCPHAGPEASRGRCD